MYLTRFFSVLIIYVPIIFLAVLLHEFVHAWVSDRLGDPLPKIQGRLSLNPIIHFDTGGLVLLLIGGVIGGIFLAIRPVRTNPKYYRHPIFGQFLVSFAGPLINLLCAFIFYPLLYFLLLKIPLYDFKQGLSFYILTAIQVNLYIGILNLLPVPPLDGAYLWMSFFFHKKYQKLLKSLTEYGMWVLLFIIISFVVVPNSRLNLLLIFMSNLSNNILFYWSKIFQILTQFLWINN